MSLTIRKVAGALGAEISGANLSADLPDGVIAQIRAALVEHQVIFFRDQSLSPEDQVAFGRRFGPLNIHPYVRGMDGYPEVMEIIKEPADKTNFGGGWHSDTSFLERPAIGSILYALELPEWGGDTLFSSQVAAYDALSPGLKAGRVSVSKPTTPSCKMFCIACWRSRASRRKTTTGTATPTSRNGSIPWPPK